MNSDLTPTLPGAYLRLDPSGGILEMPSFLADALEYQDPSENCVYDLFDTANTPHLTITRVARYKQTMIFQVGVVGRNRLKNVFRYWDASTDDELRFFFVDDSAIQRAHEWEYRKLRSSILGDLENFFSSQVENRLSTIRILSELVQSSPDLKNDAASRLIQKLDELEYLIDRVSREVKASDDVESFATTELDAKDLESVFSSWSTDEIFVEASVDPGGLKSIDSSLIDRIIFPFVQNAIESNSKNKRIQISVQSIDQDYIEFEILDHGVGMTRHEIERAEDPFFTTKRGHFGMGIARASENISKLGGYWSIESKRNQGTQVRVYIPHGHRALYDAEEE